MEHGNVAAGYRTDLGNLINKFGAKKSARYSDFVATWQELEFWRLCYGRKLDHDKAAFMEDVFLITVEYLNQKDYEHIVVIAALYTLYGLWHSQRLANKHRIRLTVKQFASLDEFANLMASQGHFDFFTVYQRMLLERAFDITMFSSPFMLGQFWQREQMVEVDEVSGHIMDDEFHKFSSVDVLRRMKDRSEVAFESYQKYQNKLLKNLPDNEEPIEFAKNVSIAAEVGECAAKVQILESKLNEDGQLALDYNSPGARRRRIKARAVRRGVQQSGDSSDYAMSPTKQTELNEALGEMDSYIPRYVRDQAAPKSVQRLKKGRPFVRGIEERIHSETDYRGGIFKVVKTKRKNNLDSGISSGSGSPREDEVEQPMSMSVVSRIEKVVTSSIQPLKKQFEDEERAERIQLHLEELEEAEATLQAKRISAKKKEELEKRLKKAKKDLEKRKKRIEKKKDDEPKESKEQKKRGRKKKIGEKRKLEDLADIKTETTEITEITENEIASIKQEVMESDDDDIPLGSVQPEKAIMAAKSSKSPRKPSPKKSLKKRPLPKLKDLSVLKENDYVMVDPKDLDHSILPENRPLIAKITEVNREDEYIQAEWMMMKTSSIGKMLYEYGWQRNKAAESCTLCLDDIFEKVDFRKGLRLSSAQASRCSDYYPDHDFD